MPLAYSAAKLAEVWDEAQPLLLDHWTEIAFFRDIPLEPRRDVYDALDGNGTLRIFTARDDGRLVGYAAFVISHHPHYASSKCASQDVLFLLPAYRSAGHGAGLITFADDALRDEGVQLVTQHVKLAFDFGPLLAHLGYTLMETIHVKRLDMHHGN